MDCSIVPTKYKNIFQVSTTDFFFPLVDDPYVMGKIACANVLSDLYALGIRECDNMLMLLSGCRGMSTEENDVVLKLIIKGFNDLAKEAGTEVTGGQTVMNEWLLLGGVAMTVAKEEEFIRPENAKEGDVLILTKPLGTQVSVNVYEWLTINPKRWNKIKDVISKEDALKSFGKATKSMSRLNKNAAVLMHKFKANGATDVTGFGILGHAANLVQNQNQNVDFVIHTLPIIKGMKAVDEKCNNMFSLLKGYSSETSGGILCAVPKDNAKSFCKELEKLDGHKAFVIGDVVKGNKKARIIDNVKVIEV